MAVVYPPWPIFADLRFDIVFGCVFNWWWMGVVVVVLGQDMDWFGSFSYEDNPIDPIFLDI